MLGDRGIKGGHGQSHTNEGTNVVWDGVTYIPGESGTTAEKKFDNGSTRRAYGGFGGGPAAGQNGRNGKDGSISGRNYFCDGGAGGAGATPIKAPGAAHIGQGGTGGHGGGGGGMGGPTEGAPDNTEIPGASGTPGQGGEGGDGAPGCVLIYYRIYKDNSMKRFCGKGGVKFNDKHERMVIA